MNASDHAKQLPGRDRAKQGYCHATMPINDESSRWIRDTVAISQQAAGVYEGGVKRAVMMRKGQGGSYRVVEDDPNQKDSTSAFLPREGGEFWGLPHARRAPRRPEVHDNDVPDVLRQVERTSAELGATNYRSPVPKKRARRDRCFHWSTSNQKNRKGDDDNENCERTDHHSTLHPLNSLD